MSDRLTPHPRPYLQRPTKAWQNLKGGLLLVAVGLVGQFFYFLFLAVALTIQVSSGTGQTSTDNADITLPLLMLVVSLLSSLLMVAGRVQCAYCPKEVGDGLAMCVSCVATLIVIASGIAVLYFSTLGQEVLDRDVAGPVILSLSFLNLAALLVAEGCFIALLHAVGAATGSKKYQRRLNAFLVGLGVGLVLGLIFSITAVSQIEGPPRFGPGATPRAMATYMTTAVSQVMLVVVLIALGTIGWYAILTFSGCGVVEGFLTKAAVASVAKIPYAAPVAEELHPPLAAANTQADDFDRYFLEEAEKEQRPPAPERP